MKLKYYTCFLIAFVICSCGAFRPSPGKLFERALKNKPYDVIIVPGYPYDGHDWNTVIKGRVIWANYLIQKKIAKNVIFSEIGRAHV